MSYKNKGFLISYNSAEMLEGLSDEAFGIVIRACIERQRDGKPFPKTSDLALKMVYTHFETIIRNRESGSLGGISNMKNNYGTYATNPENWENDYK